MSHDDYEDDLPPSKSQRKREMIALQELASELVKLSTKDLAKIPMPDELLEAVNLARSLTSRGAMRRQRQYLGKVMRHLDPEPIKIALEQIKQTGTQSTSQLHQTERWRDRIIEEGQSALNEFSAQHPQADRQQLRQLMMNSRKEREHARPPKSARTLFRCLREIIEAEQPETN